MLAEPRSRLEEALRAGEFVVTAELSTSDSADPDHTRRMAAGLRDHVVAVNCTDNTGANVHLCSLAAARLVLDAGLEPNMQLTCRDRNRLGLQADLLGAAALGVRNVTFMSGDDVGGGDHPEARGVFELDSLQLIRTARIMRDDGVYLSGRPIEVAPSLFIGAVENPFAPPYDYRPLRLAKKVRAGAEFIQTQTVFNVDRFRQFMAVAGDLGVLDDVFVLPSIGITRSARSARFMRDRVPGMDVPDRVVNRLEGVATDEQAEEGLRIAAEIVHDVREIPGVAGVHLIAIKWEAGLVRLVEELGLARVTHEKGRA